MNALCKLCKTNIVAIDEKQLSILMLAHIFEKHFNEKKYEYPLKQIVELSKEDFEITEEY